MSVNFLKLSSILLLFLLSVAHSEEFYPKSTKVINLSPSNFQNVVNKAVTIVEFYAPWCGHCKSLKPEYIKAAQMLDGLVQTAAVNCDEEANKSLAGRYGIQGFPTIKVFVPGQSQPKDYNGERSAKAIHDFALGLIPSHVKTIGSKSIDKFLSSSGDKPKVLLFTKKSPTAPLYKSLSNMFKDSVAFGEVSSKERELAERFGVADLPTLLFFPPKTQVAGEASTGSEGAEVAEGAEAAQGPLRFDGQFKLKAIKAWLETALGLEPSDLTLPELSDQSCLEAHCAQASGLCTVLITAESALPSEVRSLKQVLQDVEEARSDSLMSFAWLNGTSQREFVHQAFGLEDLSYSQVVVYAPRKGRFVSYIGSLSLEGVSDFVKSVLRGSTPTSSVLNKDVKLAGERNICGDALGKKNSASSDGQKAKKPSTSSSSKSSSSKSSSSSSGSKVVALTSTDFDSLVMQNHAPWLIEFFAPWCGHCKALAPEWTKAANAMKGMVLFGAVDCTVEQALCSRFAVQGYPTIKAFPAGAKTMSKVQDYQSARQASALSSFATGMLVQNVKALTSATYAAWLSSAASKARIILFTDKAQVPTLFKALSTHFHPLLAFAQISHSDQQAVLDFGVSAFPTIVYLPENAGTSASDARKYEGEVSFEALTQLCLKLSGPSSGADDAQPEAQSEVQPEAQHSSPVFTNVRSQEELDALCNFKGVCLLGFLTPPPPTEAVDPELEPATRAELEADWAAYAKQFDSYVDLLRGAAQQLAQQPVHVAWIDRSQANDLANALHVPEGDVGAVVVHLQKKRAAAYIGAFESHHIVSFVRSVLNGRERTFALGSLPSLTVATPIGEQPVPNKDEL